MNLSGFLCSFCATWVVFAPGLGCIPSVKHFIPELLPDELNHIILSMCICYWDVSCSRFLSLDQVDAHVLIRGSLPPKKIKTEENVVEPQKIWGRRSEIDVGAWETKIAKPSGKKLLGKWNWNFCDHNHGSLSIILHMLLKYGLNLVCSNCFIPFSQGLLHSCC